MLIHVPGKYSNNQKLTVSYMIYNKVSKSNIHVVNDCRYMINALEMICSLRRYQSLDMKSKSQLTRKH